MDTEISDHGFPCTSLHVKDAHGAPEAAISCLRTGDSLTYRGLRQEAHTLARGLTRLGLGQGDTIAYRAQDGLDLYLLAASCALLGVSLFVFEGHAPAGARSAPRLVVCAAEGAAGPGSHEWVSVDELRLFGREDASTNAASCESSAAAWAGTPGLDRLAWTIRPLRTPLSLLACGCAGGADAGEVVLRIPVAERGSEHARVEAEYRTGDIGWLTGSGALVIAGKLADVAIRGRRAVLLSDIDALLCRHPAVRSSVSFRERGISPTEPVIAAVATELDGAGLLAWLAEQGQNWLPDRVVTVPELPVVPGLAPPVRLLRAMIGGQACSAAVEALTARRFRRSPCHKEPELRTLVQSAIMDRRPLDFLMFWGCGPRSTASAPDHMAIEALGDLLTAVEEAAPVEARVDIIFTDGHATNNGHSIAHYRSYFESIERAAANLNVRFHLESDVWRRGRLSRDMVCALERTPEFALKWEAFALRDRFIRQASRHSRMADQVAAARHYYATCLLERDVLRAQFEGAVFLTYNGPEFNECFPDLPTLYIYPGPRGRTDKPWFIHDGEEAGYVPGLQLAVATE